MDPNVVGKTYFCAKRAKHLWLLREIVMGRASLTDEHPFEGPRQKTPCLYLSSPKLKAKTGLGPTRTKRFLLDLSARNEEFWFGLWQTECSPASRMLSLPLLSPRTPARCGHLCYGLVNLCLATGILAAESKALRTTACALPDAYDSTTFPSTIY